jgi:hypothetical protein
MGEGSLYNTGSETDVQDFVFRNFYVDDGLTSCENREQVVSLMKRTQRALMEGGKLRLPKIASIPNRSLTSSSKNTSLRTLKVWTLVQM